MWCNVTNAIPLKGNGQGELILSEKIIKEFYSYIITGINDNPLNFFITADHKNVFIEIRKDTNYKGYSGSGPIVRNKKKCEQKYKQPCFLFSNQRIIVWNNGTNPIDPKKSKISRKISYDELVVKLNELGFFETKKKKVALNTSESNKVTSSLEKELDKKKDELEKIKKELEKSKKELEDLKKQKNTKKNNDQKSKVLENVKITEDKIKNKLKKTVLEDKEEVKKKEVKSKTKKKEVKNKTEEKKVNGLKTYCNQAKSQEGSFQTGNKFQFKKLNTFDFLKNTNLKKMSVKDGKRNFIFEFFKSNDGKRGIGKANIEFFKEGTLSGNRSGNIRWTMLDKNILAVMFENTGGSFWKGQAFYMYIFNFVNEKELDYGFCDWGSISQIGEFQKANYSLDNALTEAEYANTPEGKLLDSYKNYILIKEFYESRKQYAVVYVSSEQFSNSRSQIKAIEKEITKNNNLNKDEIWNKATQWYEKEWAQTMGIIKSSGAYTQEAAGTVKIFLMSLNSTYNEVVEGASTPEKDF